MDLDNATTDSTRTVNKVEESAKAPGSDPIEPPRVRKFRVINPPPRTDNQPKPSGGNQTEKSQDEPEGIKNVVRRFFSFLGDEGQDETDDQTM